MPAQTSLAARVDARCRLTGQFTLRSGRTATEYFDKYLFEADPTLAAEVADLMADLVPDGTDLLAGLELGGVPLATLVAQRTGLPTLFVRKTAKEYGTKRLAEGGDPDGLRVVIIEDVITTGGAVVDAVRALREQGAVIDTVICAIDREEPDGTRLPGENLALRAALTRTMLDAARASA